MIKVIVFGCQQIVVDFIRYIKDLSYVTIPLIVTYELPLDKTYGYESVFERATEIGLTVVNCDRISESLINNIKIIEPDIIFSVYFRAIFPEALLNIPRLGCINVHPSLLPDYRGPTPTAWAIINGEKEFGITIHYMDKGIDTGDILIQKKDAIGYDETGYELYTRAMKLGAQLLIENFDKIINREIASFKQIDIGSYYGKKTGRYIIDWQQKCDVIRNLVRVHSKPYNPAETMLFNRYILVNKVTVIKDSKYIPQGVGKIVDILPGKKLIVSCVDGCLRLDDYEIFPSLTEDEKKIYFRIGAKFG